MPKNPGAGGKGGAPPTPPAEKGGAAKQPGDEGRAQQLAGKAGGTAGKALGKSTGIPGAGKVGEMVGSKLGKAALVAIPVAFTLFGVIIMGAVFGGGGGAQSTLGGFTTPESAEEFLRIADIPDDYLEAYKSAAANNSVPWPVVAAIGKLATDHGRYSPYDDACPDRRIVENGQAARLAIQQELAAINAAATERATVVSDAGGADVIIARTAALTDDEKARLAELRTASDTITTRMLSVGVSHRTCLWDRYPDVPRVDPPGVMVTAIPPWDFNPVTGEEIAPPAEAQLDPLWGRWVLPSPTGDALVLGVLPDQAVGPLSLLPAGPTVSFGEAVTHLPGEAGDRKGSAQIFESADLAGQALSIGQETKQNESGGRFLDLASVPEDQSGDWIVDELWGAVAAGVPFVTLLDDVVGACDAAPGDTVATMIQKIWRCELSRQPLSTVTAVQNGTLTVSTGDAAVTRAVNEALQVAAGFSQLGEAACDAGATTAGVFPLTTGQAAQEGIDRCDPAANILAAARIFGVGESVPPADRPATGGTYAPMRGGWANFTGALGNSEAQATFNTSGPATGTAADPACVAAAGSWASEIVRDTTSPVYTFWQTADLTDAQRTAAGEWLDRYGLPPCTGADTAARYRLALDALTANNPADLLDQAAEADAPGVQLQIVRHQVLLQIVGARAAGTTSSATEAAWGTHSFVPRLSSARVTYPPTVTALPSASTDMNTPWLLAWAIYYGGTVPEDPRVGDPTRIVALTSSLWATAPLTFVEVSALYAAAMQILELGEIITVDLLVELASAEVGSIEPAKAALFLSVYQQLETTLGQAPSEQEVQNAVVALAAPAGTAGLSFASAGAAGMVHFSTCGNPSNANFFALPQVVALWETMCQAAVREGVNLTIVSAYRSPERQKQLYDQKLAEVGGNVAEARKWVAYSDGVTCYSRHCSGMAIDVAKPRTWLHAIVGGRKRVELYGFWFPMSYEDWHIEPLGSRS
jgi:hypothetical protein